MSFYVKKFHKQYSCISFTIFPPFSNSIEKFNYDTASLKIKNSVGSITQKMSNA